MFATSEVPGCAQAEGSNFLEVAGSIRFECHQNQAIPKFKDFISFEKAQGQKLAGILSLTVSSRSST
jgi:hypothetical protein